MVFGKSSIFFSALVSGAILGLSNLAVGSDAPQPPTQKWSFQLSQKRAFDRAELQRGFQVYKEVCAVCHGLRHLAYRNLRALGFNTAEVKAIAAQYQVMDGPNDDGEMFERPARPEDRFINPYKNEKAARAANNGAYPPDLSLMVKARPGGADYVYALLTGYTPPPKGIQIPEGMHYNAYFPGHQIAMTPPLAAEGQVTYSDGTPATIQQMAKDVTTFLAWTAEPEMEERHQKGVMIMLFTLVFTILMYFSMRRVWKEATPTN